VFLDGQNTEISVFPWQIGNSVLMNAALCNLGSLGFIRDSMTVQGAKVEGMFYVTPFVGCTGGSLMQWRDFVFHKDDLAKIKQVRIELAE
jgi:hypothetical protein